MLAIMLLLQSVPPIPPATIPDPPPEALALGRRLAEAGTLASLLPMIAAKETDEVVAAHPDLSPAERDAYRRIAAATLARGSDRLFAAEGRAFAERLTTEELRALVAFQTSPVALRYRAAVPATIVATMTAMGGLDFKKDSWAAFCAETKRRC